MSWTDETDRDELVRAAVGNRRGNLSGYLKVNCPFCPARVGKEDRTRSFSFNDQTGWYRCFRCAVRGRLDGDWENIDRPPPDPRPKVQRLEEYIPLFDGPGRSATVLEPARTYLRKRGLPEQLWREAQIGAAVEGRFANRVIIPTLSARGDWRGYVARTWIKHTRCVCRYCSKPYLNATDMSSGAFMYNDAVLGEDTDEPVMAVEGCFDALALWPNAVAFLGKPKRSQVEMLATCRRPVVVVLDGDAWAEGWGIAAELRLLGQRAGAVHLPPKKDPDQVDKSWLIGEAIRSLDAEL